MTYRCFPWVDADSDTANLSASGGSALVGTAAGITVEAALALKATTANLAASTGSSLVGFLQSGTGAVARTGQDKMQEVPSLDDFGGNGNDAFDNSTAFTNLVTAKAGDGVRIGKGTYRLNTMQTLPAAGITIEGRGYDSVLKVGASSQTLLYLLSSGFLRLYNIRLVGDGTTCYGLLTSNSGSIELDTVWLDGFGGGGWRNTSLLGSVKTSIRGRNITVTGGTSAGAGEQADIYFRGQFKDVFLENLILEPDAASPIANGVNFTQAAAGEGWEGFSIRGIVCRGHGKRGIVLDNENPTADFQSGKVTIHDAKIYASVMEGIKSKNVDRILLSDIYTEGCDTTAEIAGNLQGSVYINGCEDFVGSNIIVVNGGTDGIRFNGRAAGTTAGVGRSKLVLSNYVCNTSGQYGIAVEFGTQGMTINNPVLYDCGGGIKVENVNLNDQPDHITINSPIIRRTTGSLSGINVVGVSGYTVGHVTINDPDIRDCGGNGISATYTDSLTISGGQILDNGQGGSSTRGITVTNTGRLKIHGVRSSNDVGSTQVTGLNLSTGNGVYDIQNNDFTGNATTAASYSAPSTSVTAANNQGWLSGSATYDPPSLLDAAGTTTTVTVTGASLGDYVDAVSFSLDLQGITVTAYVSSANTVSARFQNESGGTLDLASGTLSVKVRKINP